MLAHGKSSKCAIEFGVWKYIDGGKLGPPAPRKSQKTGLFGVKLDSGHRQSGTFRRNQFLTGAFLANSGVEWRSFAQVPLGRRKLQNYKHASNGSCALTVAGTSVRQKSLAIDPIHFDFPISTIYLPLIVGGRCVSSHGLEPSRVRLECVVFEAIRECGDARSLRSLRCFVVHELTRRFA